MTTVVVERDLPVVVRDGTTLLADVYRPSTGTWPVLLERTAYGKTTMIGTMVHLDPLRAATAGYAVVIQDVRGRGASEGDYEPFVHEADDGSDTVAWAAGQPWSTGRVGMFGNSYMAATQWQAALNTPPDLVALCPVQASPTTTRVARTGAGHSLGGLLTVNLYAAGVGSAARISQDRDEMRRVWRDTRHLLDDLSTVAAQPVPQLRDTVVADLAPYFFDWVDHAEPGPYWERITIEGRYEHVTVPVLHVTSWYDQFHVGTLRNYEGMRATGRDDQYLVVGPWGHYPPRSALVGSARVGQLDFGLSAVIDLDALQLSWFDRWLRDDTTSWRLRSRVRLFVMGDNEWRWEDEWPLARATEQALHLGPDGRLGWEPPDDPVAMSTFVHDPADPVPTLGGAHLVLESSYPQGPHDQRALEDRPDVVVFTTDVLDADVEVTGWVEAELWVASSASSTDFAVKLIDVWPDGRAMGVCDGITRVSGADGGEPLQVDVRLGATAQVFKRGHRVRVHVSSSNSPRFDVNRNPARDDGTAVQRIFHDPTHPSRLRLPVVRRD